MSSFFITTYSSTSDPEIATHISGSDIVRLEGTGDSLKKVGNDIQVLTIYFSYLNTSTIGDLWQSHNNGKMPCMLETSTVQINGLMPEIFNFFLIAGPQYMVLAIKPILLLPIQLKPFSLQHPNDIDEFFPTLQSPGDKGLKKLLG
jgi:hypothetical protein